MWFSRRSLHKHHPAQVPTSAGAHLYTQACHILLQHFQHPAAICSISSLATSLRCQVLLHLPQPPRAALEGTLSPLQLLLLGL
jgi:hypothetical protein